MFCSVINCLYICVCACLLQNNMRMYIQINIHRSKVLCGSAFEPGGSGLPYYCTPPVCVPAVLGALAVWRLSTAQKKNHTHTHTLKVQSLPCAWFRSRSLSFFLVRWSVICYQHGFAKGALPEEYLSHKFDEHCLGGHWAYLLPFLP